MEKTAMNIYQRINEVRKTVAYIRKEKEVTGGGTYKVVTHDQVTGEIREPFIEHGIIVVPQLITSDVRDTGTTTGKGIPIIRYEARYNIAFVNCDQPEDKIIVCAESHATDQGDKAPGKAISYAVKYAMLKLLSIETGEDEEGRQESNVAEKIVKPDAAGKRALEACGSEASLRATWKNLTQGQRDTLNDVARECRKRILEADNATTQS